MNFLNEIISGGLSVDLMDYLPRDSYFSGTEYGKIDYHRIINSLEVSSHNNLGINKSSLYSYESMLISRYQMFKAVYFHKSVRSGEVMLVHSMKIQNDALNLAPPNSLEEFFVLHDEMVLEKLSRPSNYSQANGVGNNVGIKLAKDYQNRNLLKCVYEFFLLSSQRNKNKVPSTASESDIEKGNINGIELFDDQIEKLTKIVEEYRKSGYPIFLDVSRAPSIPLAPKKREVTSIMIIDKKSEFEKSFDQIPLINAISGYLDMIRIYTTRDNRQFFENVFDSHFN
ncbi:MAG: hypothetical protein H0U27_08480 [Nitrosopumilus sp.]|nr:hypothetical protein [Nitrosopumilus sp.]